MQLGDLPEMHAVAAELLRVRGAGAESRRLLVYIEYIYITYMCVAEMRQLWIVTDTG